MCHLLGNQDLPFTGIDLLKTEKPIRIGTYGFLSLLLQIPAKVCIAKSDLTKRLSSTPDKMRRKDKQIHDQQEIEGIFNKAHIIHLAMVDQGRPYVIPLNFGYQDNKIYFHCAPKGRKIDILKQNSEVCFELVGDYKIVDHDSACNWTCHYESIIGYGTCSFIQDGDEKKRALDIIMNQYSNADWSYNEKSIRGTTVVEIAIQEITGKSSV